MGNVFTIRTVTQNASKTLRLEIDICEHRSGLSFAIDDIVGILIRSHGRMYRKLSECNVYVNAWIAIAKPPLFNVCGR